MTDTDAAVDAIFNEEAFAKMEEAPKPEETKPKATRKKKVHEPEVMPEEVAPAPEPNGNLPTLWTGRFPDMELDLAETLEAEFNKAQDLAKEIKELAREKVDTLTAVRNNIQAQTEAAKVHLKSLGLVANK
jgi:hypothetical protein